MSEWISYTNEKLFLAARLETLARSTQNRADQSALEQGRTLLLGQALEGLLNELAATRRLRDRVSNLADLVEKAGYSWEWTDRLQALAVEPDSWLMTLQASERTLQKRQVAAVPAGGDLGVELIGRSGNTVDWLALINDMKAFAAELRETNAQY